MNRRGLRMHRAASVALCGLGLLASKPARAQAARLDTFRVAMPELGGRSRLVRVRLPAGYGAGGRRYPVLYLHDGQNLFSAGGFGDWRVDETVDSLAAAGRSAGMIVVGIDNGPRRWDEYSPWVNRRMHDWFDPAWADSTEGGEGAAYVAFLANTLKPEIDRRYRTLADREHTGVGGSSMGGLISLYAGLARPDVFSKVMAMSPAVWFAEDGGPWLSANQLLAFIASRPAPADVRFYVDAGTAERSRDADPAVADGTGRPVTYPRAYLAGAEAAFDALRAAGVPGRNLRLVLDDDAIHHESAWARRLPTALLWLYPPSR